MPGLPFLLSEAKADAGDPDGPLAGTTVGDYRLGARLLHPNLARCFGLVHADVNPENFVVRPDGSVKLIDLGLAQPMGRDGKVPSLDGALRGTPAYMSPEQVKSRPLDARSGSSRRRSFRASSKPSPPAPASLPARSRFPPPSQSGPRALRSLTEPTSTFSLRLCASAVRLAFKL